jgi:hypothetical protein
MLSIQSTRSPLKVTRYNIKVVTKVPNVPNLPKVKKD